jgi:hypothetical protein
MSAQFDHLLVVPPEAIQRERFVTQYWRRADRLRQLAEKPLLNDAGRAMMLEAASEFDDLARQVATH